MDRMQRLGKVVRPDAIMVRLEFIKHFANVEHQIDLWIRIGDGKRWRRCGLAGFGSPSARIGNGQQRPPAILVAIQQRRRYLRPTIQLAPGAITANALSPRLDQVNHVKDVILDGI
jgi:hypothetical protein